MNYAIMPRTTRVLSNGSLRASINLAFHLYRSDVADADNGRFQHSRRCIRRSFDCHSTFHSFTIALGGALLLERSSDVPVLLCCCAASAPAAFFPGRTQRRRGQVGELGEAMWSRHGPSIPTAYSAIDTMRTPDTRYPSPGTRASRLRPHPAVHLALASRIVWVPNRETSRCGRRNVTVRMWTDGGVVMAAPTGSDKLDQSRCPAE